MTMEHIEAIRLRMREARLERKLTQQATADLMDISRDYYQRVEGGPVKPSLKFVEKFCRALGVPLDDVLGEAKPTDELLQQWPDGYRILRRAAEGPAWQREQLQRLFEAVYGENAQDGPPTRKPRPAK